MLTLVEEGRIGLDDRVERHLTRWRFPASAHDAAGVTVRRLLSHTAGFGDGFGDGLGYDGFADPGDVQGLAASLEGAADAMSGAPVAVTLDHAPVGRWRYSGGGCTVLQLLVEDVTGRPFADAMTARVLDPLGVDGSGYGADRIDTGRLAPFLDAAGAPAPHDHYAALGAAALHTSAADMARFLHAMSDPAPEEVPSVGLRRAIRQPEGRLVGVPIWGLGATLSLADGPAGPAIGRNGRNRPATSTTARPLPETGEGMVVLATGATDLAPRLGADWVVWATGRVGNPRLERRLPRVAVVWGAGVLALVAGVVALDRRGG